MKKLISILLAFSLCVSLCACGENPCIDNEETSNTTTIAETTETTTEISSESQSDYILNTNSMKFHYPSCHAAEKISDKNKKEYYGTRDVVVEQGYKSCGICNP